MKRWILALVILTFSSVYAKPYNWIIGQVGKYSITDYDLSQMVLFEKTMGKTNITKKNALKELLMTYAIFDFANQDEKYQVSESDIDKTIKSLTNVNEDEPVETVRQRQKLYSQFPDALRMQLKKNRIMQTLFFYNETLKQKLNESPDETKMKKFYKDHPRLFLKMPKVDIIAFVVKKNKNWSFDKLENVESSMREIASKLEKGKSADNIKKEYGKLKFESYSGRSGLKDLRELNSAGYPQELILLPLQKTMKLPEMKEVKGVPTYTGKQVNRKVGPGFVFYIGQPMPLRGKKGLYYVVLKVIKRVEPDKIPYEEVKSKIAMEMKNQHAVDILENMIRDKFKKKEIFISIFDKSYKGVYNEFIRG